jgi:hypothetical protein
MARKVKSSVLRGSGPPAPLPGPATDAEDDDAAPLRLGGPMRRIHISGDCKGLRPGPAGASGSDTPAVSGWPEPERDADGPCPGPEGPRSSRKRTNLSELKHDPRVSVRGLPNFKLPLARHWRLGLERSRSGQLRRLTVVLNPPP